MNLLIFTQKVDRSDDVLGFFHRWINVFAKEYRSIIVVCLEEGEHALPENVKVYSLGKEKGGNKILYIWRFYKYLLSFRKEYDSVFVHMNQEYVLLGAALWRLQKKRIGFWYNHTYGGLKTRLAMRFANIVFHTSQYAYTANSKKSIRMPAGIDTSFFKPEKREKKQKSILYIGRIAPVKGLHILLQAVKILRESGESVALDIYGAALQRDREYEENVKTEIGELIQKGSVVFHGAITNDKTPELYNSHQVFVNLTPEGNYDKTILEALACETKVLVSSKAFENDLPKIYQFIENNSEHLAEQLKKLFDNTEETDVKYNLRNYIIKNHSLDLLAKKLKELLIRK